MSVKLLSEIPLYKARSVDMARAVSNSMKWSKKTAWIMTRALNLNGNVGSKHMNMLYGADAFTKDGRLSEEVSQKLIKQVRADLKLPKEQKFVSLLDYAKAFIEEVLHH